MKKYLILSLVLLSALLTGCQKQSHNIKKNFTCNSENVEYNGFFEVVDLDDDTIEVSGQYDVLYVMENDEVASSFASLMESKIGLEETSTSLPVTNVNKSNNKVVVSYILSKREATNTSIDNFLSGLEGKGFHCIYE